MPTPDVALGVKVIVPAANLKNGTYRGYPLLCASKANRDIVNVVAPVLSNERIPQSSCVIIVVSPDVVIRISYMVVAVQGWHVNVWSRVPAALNIFNSVLEKAKIYSWVSLNRNLSSLVSPVRAERNTVPGRLHIPPCTKGELFVRSDPALAKTFISSLPSILGST